MLILIVNNFGITFKFFCFPINGLTAGIYITNIIYNSKILIRVAEIQFEKKISSILRNN